MKGHVYLVFPPQFSSMLARTQPAPIANPYDDLIVTGDEIDRMLIVTMEKIVVTIDLGQTTK